LRLPLSGEKNEKDISDFFKMGHSQDDLMMLFREMLDQLYEDTIAVMRSCEIDFDNPPKAPEPLLTINEVTIGTPGNLVCIAGSEGSGKTNFLGGILSGAIKPEGIDIDTLGTTIRENIDEQSVILYDTEQSEFQLYKNLTYILKRTSLSKPPAWFKAYCLVGISRNERMNLILESMDRFFYENGGIHMVVIDGIADLLGAVNDEESSVKLVEELFRMAAIYNTVIICVLHMAPSGMKLRGHLGSEVQRKAAGILLIEKDENNNSSVIKALKVRDGSPLDVPMIQFGWSKEEGRHVYLGEKSKEDSEMRKVSELKDAAATIFKDKHLITNQNLIKAVMELLDVKERTARAYIKYMREHEIIERSSGNPQEYQLFAMPF
jgi:energy-coupling factor transporter ATP-binding protein EcfA2